LIGFLMQNQKKAVIEKGQKGFWLPVSGEDSGEAFREFCEVLDEQIWTQLQILVSVETHDVTVAYKLDLFYILPNVMTQCCPAKT